MRKLVVSTLALLLVVPALVRAADADNSVQGQFYSFVAPVWGTAQYGNTGAGVGGYNLGVGGEVLMRKGVGVGIEFGYTSTWSNGQGSALGVGSLDATYHFLGNKTRKSIDPFVTGGYSLYYGERTVTQSGFNLGCGVNLWLSKHAAPRLEILYQGGINGFQGFSPFTGYEAFRFGVTFR